MNDICVGALLIRGIDHADVVRRLPELYFIDWLDLVVLKGQAVLIIKLGLELNPVHLLL